MFVLVLGAEYGTTSDLSESGLELLDASIEEGMKVFVLLTSNHLVSRVERSTKTHYLSSKAQVISAKALSQPWLTLY